MMRVSWYTDPNMAAQILLVLTTIVLETVNDPTHARLEMGRGLPQGSPLSPSLLNVYIDVLAELWQDHENQESALTLFADDIRQQYNAYRMG